MRKGWGALLLALWLGHAAVRADATPPKAAQAQYRELITKALQEYALGHWPEARVFFADAHALWPNARSFRGLGMTCYEARSYVEAIDYLEHALDNPIQPLTPKLADEARAILQQAQRFVSSLSVEVEPATALITVDDRPLVRRANGGSLLDPGEHQLDVTAAGYRAYHRGVTAEAGRPLHVHLELTPLTDDANAVSTAAQPPASSEVASPRAPEGAPPQLAGQQPVAAGVLTGLGIAGIATGWVMYAFRNDARLTLWRQGLASAAKGGAVFDQELLQHHRQRGVIALSSAGAGSLLLGFAEYFWLPDEPAVPVWAWVVGGVGAATALASLGAALFLDHCRVTDSYYYCQRVTSDPLFAPLIAVHAVPLLSLPIMYALRKKLAAKPLQVAIDWSAGPRVSVRGVF